MEQKQALKEKETRLATLFEEYYDRIARYAFTRIGDHGDAEDLASDVFVKALNALDSFEERGLPMGAWLFKIAHNLVVDYHRRRSQRKTADIEKIDVAADGNLAIEVENRIEMERVTDAMESLSEEQREIIRLRFYGGLSSAEVGAVLGKSDGAVREAQSTAIKKIRIKLT